MKIFQINASYKPAYIYGGPTMSVSKLSEELAKHNIQVEVLTTTANGPKELPVKVGEKITVDGVEVTYYSRITKDHSHFSPELIRALKKKLSKTLSPIVHIHAWWNLVSILAALIAKWTRIPVILSPRGTLSGYSFINKNSGIKGYFHKFVGKVLLEYCYFHVTSDKEKNDIECLIKPRKVFVIPNFVRIPNEDEELKDRKTQNQNFNKLKLLFISRLEEKKGLELLFESLKNFESDWHLDIAGSGEESYVKFLKNLSEAQGLTSRITWLGHVDNKNKFILMAEHDVMVLPSFDENFANVVVECLSVGTPVLLTKNVGLADYVETNNLGWVCDRTKEDIVRKLQLIYSQMENIGEIREKAPYLIREDFGDVHLIKKYLSMYSDILHLQST